MEKKSKENLYVLPVQKCLSGMDVECLADHELLAIVLGTGLKDKNVINLSLEIIQNYGGINGLFYSGVRELASVRGVGLKKALRIHAAFQLGKRILSDNDCKMTVDSPEKVWKLVLPDIICSMQEEFRVLVLNNKNHLIRKKVVSLGTVSEALVHPREIFRDAIKESASSIIVSHNHPSGVLSPSTDDIRTTTRLVEAGRIIGIELLDHVIVSDNSFLSMKEEGYM